MGSVPDHQNKTSGNHFARRGSCFQFAKQKNKKTNQKNTTPVKHNKEKHNKMRYAYADVNADSFFFHLCFQTLWTPCTI